MTERFNNAIQALQKAFNEGTLANTYMNGVIGTICAHAIGFHIPKDYDNWDYVDKETDNTVWVYPVLKREKYMKKAML
jgi:hypothetical protein